RPPGGAPRRHRGSRPAFALALPVLGAEFRLPARAAEDAGRRKSRAGEGLTRSSGSLQPGDPQRRAKAGGAVERIAVFPVDRRMMGAGEQQPVAVPALVLAPILDQD